MLTLQPGKRIQNLSCIEQPINFLQQVKAINSLKIQTDILVKTATPKNLANSNKVIQAPGYPTTDLR